MNKHPLSFACLHQVKINLWINYKSVNWSLESLKLNLNRFSALDDTHKCRLQIWDPRNWYEQIAIFFLFQWFPSLPTTCMSPDTSIVLKCGASAETIRSKREKIHENISRHCDFYGPQITFNSTQTVGCERLRPSASITVQQFRPDGGAIRFRLSW